MSFLILGIYAAFLIITIGIIIYLIIKRIQNKDKEDFEHKDN
ncbi:hypothetical protein [Wenyingzhuangia marina]|uniref:Uncharacterized protein n=1 Tax=Wenyingzhuangia marina TaxID=1195760 RepID=A0A1M5VY16_9FLAO|nr:hypothetical protein [Wenyingzhuangia marina]SHH79894.1 hypothetical protein SAMN05444281_2033 [Wenyingzhuangia marina]